MNDSHSLSLKSPISSSLRRWFITIFLFVFLLGVGFRMAYLKPLWNDEIFTQIYSVDNITFKDIVLGNISEGNHPLFYVLQKATTTLLGFRANKDWDGQTYIYDKRAQVIMRIVCNVFVSMSLALMFYFFSQYSYPLATYSLLLILSMSYTSDFWVMSRPYALWFFLTMVQTFLFLRLSKQNAMNPRDGKILLAVNVLLILTIVFSLIQVCAVSFLLLLKRRINWKSFLVVVGVPSLVGAYYQALYLKSNFKFWFYWTPWQLIQDTIPLECLIVLALYVVFILFVKFNRRLSWIKSLSENVTLESEKCFWFISLIAFLVLLLIGYMLSINTHGPEGGVISGRYFIFLVPICVIVICHFFWDLLQIFKRDLLMLINVIVVFNFVWLVILLGNPAIVKNLVALILNV